MTIAVHTFIICIHCQTYIVLTYTPLLLIVEVSTARMLIICDIRILGYVYTGSLYKIAFMRITMLNLESTDPTH